MLEIFRENNYIVNDDYPSENKNFGIYPLLEIKDTSLCFIIGQLTESFDVKLLYENIGLSLPVNMYVVDYLKFFATLI